MTAGSVDLELPYLTREVPGVPARARERPGDFEVEELPAYGPSGAGEHVLFEIEKEGLSTHAAIGRLARELGVPPGRFGHAGLKDARARTRQRLSVQGAEPSTVAALELEGLRVLSAARHGSKLRVGHLKGNRFRLRLRGLPTERDEDVRRVLATLARRGVPNIFGPQRFGARGDNWKVGRDLLAGGARRMRARHGRERLRFFVGAWQAWLFNRVLAARMPDVDRLQAGDLAWLHDRGAVFAVEDVAREAPRAAAFEVSPSGPLFGAQMIEPRGEPLALERAVLADHGLEGPDLGGPRFLSWKGARRPLRVPLAELAHGRGVDADGDYLELAFVLPAGAYATGVLRELVKDTPGSASRP